MDEPARTRIERAGGPVELVGRGQHLFGRRARTARHVADLRQIGPHRIDAIGGEAEARDWLSTEMDVAADMRAEDVTIGDDADAWLQELRGLSEKMMLSERLTLDGLVAVWHPDLR